MADGAGSRVQAYGRLAKCPGPMIGRLRMAFGLSQQLLNGPAYHYDSGEFRSAGGRLIPCQLADPFHRRRARKRELAADKSATEYSLWKPSAA